MLLALGLWSSGYCHLDESHFGGGPAVFWQQISGCWLADGHDEGKQTSFNAHRAEVTAHDLSSVSSEIAR